jgi:hypothetical protein
MPSAYTDKIVKGSITEFEDFAKLCTKAFLIHLRDEPLSTEYKKREPSNYHLKQIERAKKELKELENISNEQLLMDKRSELINDRDRVVNNVKNTKKLKSTVLEFLDKAKKFKPPTESHKGIKEFMIEQLESTIKWDCSTEWSDRTLENIEKNLKNLDAEKVREVIKDNCLDSIEYHTKEHEKELQSCNDTNQWYQQFIQSLEK